MTTKPETAPVTDEEARQILIRFNASHFNNLGEHARYSIPADPRRDDDLRLAAYIDQTERMRQRDAAHAERIRELEAANRGESSRADELRRMCLELEQRAASLEAEADRKDAARVEAEQAAKAARTRCAELTAENECLTSQRAATDATTAELQQAAKRLRKERDGQRTEKERQLRKLAEAEAAAGKAIASLEAQLATAREVGARIDAEIAEQREPERGDHETDAGTEETDG
jgi:DNA repair exonuclease SbcCD ATPase subunit